MTWNYRIVRYRDTRKGLALHEVFYNDAEEPVSMTEQPITFGCEEEEGRTGIMNELAMAFTDCWRHPILDEPEAWASE